MSPSPVQPTRRHLLLGAAAGLTATTLEAGVLARPASAGRAGAKPSAARSQTLITAGFLWGPPSNFNMFGEQTWPTQVNSMQLVYETLFTFDIRDGTLRPQLAGSFKTDYPNTLTVKLRPEAHWRDGRPLTAHDVVYTVELARRYPEVQFSDVWLYIDAVSAPDRHTVVFHLNQAQLNPGMIKAHLAQIPIVPRHLWEKLERRHAHLSDYWTQDPLGSGPYRVQTADDTQLVMVRDDRYWGRCKRGGLPAPRYIVHPVFDGNDAGNAAFERGDVDVMQQYLPEIWKLRERGLPVGTWLDSAPYHVPGAMPMMIFNTLRPGLNDPRVRRAIAFAVDYARIARDAVSNYSDPAKSSLLLPQGPEASYFDAANVARNGWRTDPAEAIRILEQDLGAVRGTDGVYRLPDGTRLGGWRMQAPTGWTDWQTAIEIVAENARAIGIEIIPTYPSEAETATTLYNAEFDIAVWHITATTPSTPWQRFRDVLDMRGVPAPGLPASYNYGRFDHPDTATLLDKAAVANGTELISTITRLDTLFMEHAPMVPLMYRPLEFFEFNQTVWTGFPTAANPTAPPSFQGAGVDWLYRIRPRRR
ncbi:ABC transporter substrate-binding protein [Actinoplanes subglobosus]|uniref:ABC transporter substrate-binding protein n=1 Tax=Actinoplanes subglobosus TaxID=1547892 RepID=A0ABV8J1U2_9ACTN